ncbi:MAG: YebC/PmpR family DNA-binding transcriptional regulator [Candidatus Marinimicrobia bacterium]|nr:YebC/PmpR family DNA-binding transcriptional regulator [Candidatus Neomarinimicrobiota bacterium]|tara:strand:+ start:4829 stop:5575 length:747 start_codon:yes stop_codon:yes gene_type:complete
MAGHSKWAQIKRKKAIIDAKRGQVFTKIIKEITVASRLGGGDENANPRLRQAIISAKNANMPAENIKRAIQKGTGELPGVNYEESIFEGYGPEGVAIMIEVTTDNRNRTVAELRHLITKYGGNLGESGCVSWMFEKKASIAVDKKINSEDLLFESVLLAGGEDFIEEDDVYIIQSSPEKMIPVIESLQKNGFIIKTSELLQVPMNYVKIKGETAKKVIKLMEELDFHEDVQKVSANFDFEEDSVGLFN